MTFAAEMDFARWIFCGSISQQKVGMCMLRVDAAVRPPWDIEAVYARPDKGNTKPIQVVCR